MPTASSVHPAFSLQRSQNIDALKVCVEEYQHRKTGAVHFHLAADNPENVFLVALRTLPKDSTGVAHILEHTALCGSEHYPVRDPFFMMIRRSLNTFMNAFTSNDWTAYPFASQNRKDFDNLLSVYLDAVFFSRLDPLDFAQEGHRLEFAEPSNPDSALLFKGVVFNEMKGAMSSVPATLWQTLCKYLYPTTTYHYNSGGEPEHIPDLSYEQLQAFYQSHYHPSNAIFMTYGDIPARHHQEKFEQLALSRFDALPGEISVGDEKRYYAPIRVEESYAFGEPGSKDNKTHIVLGWLLGKTTDLEDSLTSQLVTSVLLDNSASPLQKVLETTELGGAPSPLCGLEDSNRELVFVCGIEGSEPDNADALEQLVMDTLSQVATDGVPTEHVEAILHQLELHQREIGGDGYPYGLQLILTGLTSATHRGDPIALLDLEPVLAKLREQIQDPEFIKTKVRELLIDNPHRVRLVMRPDEQLAERKDLAEAARLQRIKAALNDTQKQQIVQQAELLAARQTQKDDESILPKVGLDDVPKELKIPTGNCQTIAGMDCHYYAQGTNGLVYEQLIIPLPELDDELLEYLPYYTASLTELGVGEETYLDTQQRQASVCGSISAFTSTRSDIDDEQQTLGYFILSAKALARNHLAMSELLRDTLTRVRFDELSRIREVLAQIRAKREQSITGNGHALAMLAACSGMNPLSALTHRLSGLQGIQSIKALDTKLKQPDALQQLADALGQIHHQVLEGSCQLLVIAEDERREQLLEELQQCWQAHDSGSKNQVLQLPPLRQQRKQIWTANTQVNFCARAYPTVAANHPDAPALTVLGGFLRNGYLHRTIREQGGAYGGGASQDSGAAAFRFFSYRDPRLVETLQDFDRAIEWLLNEDHEWQKVEEAILGVVSSIDKPGSPAGEAKQAFHNDLFGRDADYRQRFRSAVLKVSAEDLKRVARRYLSTDKASTAVVSNKATIAATGIDFAAEGFSLHEV